ncbi:MAG: prenyltransferase/squalene oxidase repeat-containing protein [Verrucomicrobiota bacterium]
MLPSSASSPIKESNGSLALEVSRAISSAVRWLESQQKENGSWSDPQHPALSALALLALEKSKASDARVTAAIERRGFQYIRSFAKEDGGIYAEGLSNYNTSLCLLALLQGGDPADANLISKARAFVEQQQASNMLRPELNGGIGYGPTGVSPKRQHPDLDNTLMGLEAVRASLLLDKATEKPSASRLNWEAAIAFISRCQNLSPAEPADIPGTERGGFNYYPSFSNAGEIENSRGNKALRSSGTMSYAGLLSFIYADLPKEDPRLLAALDWLNRNYTLEENPGLGQQGLYYYYHLMAKGLTAAGVASVSVNGKNVDWARELAVRLVSQQEASGMWVNSTGRWMEKDPVLVTSYAILTLSMLRDRL